MGAANVIWQGDANARAIQCLDEDETLSPGQLAEIDRVYRAYPHLHDDEFVASHRDEWLR